MAGVNKKQQQLKPQFSGRLVLCVILALPVWGSAAHAQDAGMRSTFDPESPLAQSPLNKAVNNQSSKRLQAAAPRSSVKYTTETLSDADIEAEALQQLLGEDELDGDGENIDGKKPKGKATSLTELEPENDSSMSVPAGKGAKITKGKKSVTKNGKPVRQTTGKTTLNPALDAQTTGTLTVRKGQNAQMLRAQRAIPQEAVQSRDLIEEENPFGAVGLRVGSITLRPTLEQGIEVNSKATGAAATGSTTNSITTVRLDGASDWRKGSLETTGFLTLRRAFSGESVFDPEAGATLKLTQPLLNDWSYAIGASYGLKRESAVSGSAFPTTFTKRPLAQDVGVSFSIGKNEGLLQPSAKLELNRSTYGDAIGPLGVAVSQSDRNQTSLRGTFRLGAEISPAITPFVELVYGKTWRDERVDVFGNDRSSDDLRASVGAEVNLSKKLNGEFSVGWLRQSYHSASLNNIEGLALAAALNWSPQQGTTVTAGLTTSAEPTNSATVSGSLLHTATVGITHQLSSRLSASASLGASYRDFTAGGGNDTTLSAELTATYWVNRLLGVNAKARYESVSSSDPMRESDTTTFLLGLKFQR